MTRREAEVLEALAEHFTNAEIAERLYISIRTVETHVSSLLAKLGGESRRELAAMGRAIQARWAGSNPLPRPVILSLAEQGPFVGRVAELVRLRRAWKEASTGRGGVVLVAGEPGIGKSRLAAELALEAHKQGATLLYGRCDEELRVIYQPFAQALGAYLDSRPPEQLQAQLGALGGELARMVPGLPARLPGLPEPLPVEPDTAQYRLFEAVRELLVGIAGLAPLLLVLDDLQWAAKPALTLLRHVARSCESLPLLIVGTYRDANTIPGHPLADVLADLRREPGIERLVLGGLDEADVTTLVQALSPPILDAAALGRAIHAHTEGNPFFVLELVRHLDDSATTASRSGPLGTEADLLGLGVPEGVREIVHRRLSPLPDAAREVLSMAAVIGQEFDFAVLAEATRTSREELLDAIEHAERDRLIVAVPGRPGHYAFGHALIRAAIYSQLPTTRRRRLHRLVGQALEQRPDADSRLAELAHHFGQAAPFGEQDRAVVYARRAGDQARAGLAFEEAASHYEAALTALELDGAFDRSLACDLRIALGDALHRSGDPRHEAVLARASEDARALGDARRLGEVVLAFNLMGYSSAIGRVREDIVALAEEALGGLGDADSPLRARLLAVLAAELRFSSESARRAALSVQAVAVARRVSDRATLARVLASHLWASRDPDHLKERVVAAGELAALGRELGDPEAAFWGHIMRSWDLHEAGDVVAADADLDAAEALARQLRQPLAVFRSTMRRACQALLAGHLAEGERLACEAREIGQRGGLGESLVAPVLGLQVFLLHYERGQLSDVESTIAATVETQPGAPIWQALLALLYCETGRPAQAVPHFERFSASDFTAVPRDLLWLTGMVIAASVAAALDDAAKARVLYRALTPYSGRNTCAGPTSNGPVDLALGVLAAALGRQEDAERHFTAAADLCLRMRAPTWLARTRYEWAKMLLFRNVLDCGDRASTLAAESRIAAEELGMTGLAEQARVLTGHDAVDPRALG